MRSDRNLLKSIMQATISLRMLYKWTVSRRKAWLELHGAVLLGSHIGSILAAFNFSPLPSSLILESQVVAGRERVK